MNIYFGAPHRALEGACASKAQSSLAHGKSPPECKDMQHEWQIFILCVGRDSSAGTATRYGLDGPGIEFRRRRDFLHAFKRALGPNQTPVQLGTRSVSGG